MATKTLTNPKITTVSGFLLSAVLLTVIQEPFGISWLAWIAWVPFILACGQAVSTKRLLIAAYLVGLCYWVYNLHWLYIVTFPGYITFSFVQAFYWVALAYCVQFVLRKQWPLFVWAPLLFVGDEALQGYLFTGFCWYYLAHSQYQHLPLIQICDVFGALGISILIAMVNGIICDWILHLKSKEKIIGQLVSAHFYGTILCLALLTGSYFYGQKRLNETSGYLTEGPFVGSVQPNVAANVKEEIDNGPKILDDMIADSEKCIEAGAKLVIWPETMVMAYMNPQFLFSDYVSAAESRNFRSQILNVCKDRTYVLFGASAITQVLQDIDQYNSAFLYRPDGQEDPKRYDKIHLVPFGEYIPFKNSIPWLYKMILYMSPYDYDYNLTAGTDHTVFEINVDEQIYRFGVLICYEDTDPTVTRKHVLDKDGNKAANWLVNISNDGWYVRFKNKKVLPMAELTQRTAISVFRCIENRISIVRSVNTGISCLIDPTGAIRNDFRAGDLPEQAMARQGVKGWFVDSVPIDNRITFFSRHGRWLDAALAIFFVLNFGYCFYSRRKQQHKTGEQYCHENNT